MKYEIGSRIRKQRESLGISQRQLAEQIGVSNGRISNWEQGLNRPDADMLAELCRVLKVSPSSLLGIKLFKDELSNTEWKIIQAYREKNRFAESSKYPARNRHRIEMEKPILSPDFTIEDIHNKLQKL